jgi:hypothetical protein
VAIEAVSPSPGPMGEQQRARDKHSEVLTEKPQKIILEDRNKRETGEEKREKVSSTGEPLTETQSKQTNACKKKMKQQLYDDLETVPEKCFACDDFVKGG